MSISFKWLITCVAVLIFSGPAVAADPACTAIGVAKNLSVAFGEFDCVQVGGGQRAGIDFGIITKRGTSAKSLQPYLARIPGIVDRSFSFWQNARSFKTGPVTLVLIAPKDVALSSHFAATHFQKVTPEAFGNRCLIEVNLGKLEDLMEETEVLPTNTEFINGVISHEMAHCVEEWNVLPQMQVPSGIWWYESVAETLASVAYPGSMNYPKRRYKQFKASISTKPITQQPYVSMPFFLWLWRVHPADVFDFMEAMPVDKAASEADHWAATLAFLAKAMGGNGAERIQRFAQIYVDNELPNEAGAPMGPPTPPKKQTIAGTDVIPIGGLPGTIQTVDVTFSGGKYSVRPVSMAATATARPPAYPSPWAALPTSIDVACNGSRTFKLAFVPTDKSDKAAHYEVTQTKKCEPKTKPLANGTSSCVTGKWTIDRSRWASLLASQLGKDGHVDSVTGSIDLEFLADGNAVVSAHNFAAELRNSGQMPFKITLSANGTDNGAWSASGDFVTYKASGSSLSTVIKIKIGPIANTRYEAFLFSSAQYQYACGQDALTLTYRGTKTANPPVFHLIPVNTD